MDEIKTSGNPPDNGPPLNLGSLGAFPGDRLSPEERQRQNREIRDQQERFVRTRLRTEALRIAAGRPGTPAETVSAARTYAAFLLEG